MHRTSNALSLLVVILGVSTGSPISYSVAPDFIWEYYDQRDGVYYHVEPLSDGSCVTAGTYSVGSSYYPGVVKFNPDGQEVWSWEVEIPSGAMTDVQPLEDGTFAAVGGVPPMSGLPSYQLLVILAANGTELSRFWYDHEESSAAYSVVQLPDGGFVIGGTILLFDVYTPTLTRVSSDGTVIWSIEPEGVSGAVRKVILTNEGNVIAMVDPSYKAPVVIEYSLDGVPVWTCDYTGSLLYGDGDLCSLNNVNEYAVVSREHAIGIDSLGGLVWLVEPPGSSERKLLSVAPTIDGGLILSGADHYYENFEPYSYHAFNGWLIKTDSQGNYEWHISRDPGNGHTYYYCARQFGIGGYIVSGSNNGHTYLARLAPETGIQVDPQSGFASSLVPNPFDSEVMISIEVSEPGKFGIAIFDISGRLQVEINTGFLTCGYHTYIWRPARTDRTAIYLVRIASEEDQMVLRAVKL